MIRNWKYYERGEKIGEIWITRHQYMTGNVMGMLVEPKRIEKPEYHLCNAKSFDFPVRYKVLHTHTRQPSWRRR